MSTPQTIAARAKKAERQVQQYLWPGTKFAGGAKRPALEQCDLRGTDAENWPLWGEVKNYGPATVQAGGGLYSVLLDAYNQSESAIADNPQDWPKCLRGAGVGVEAMCPHPFAVLWPKGSRRDDQRLVMYALPGWGMAIITLAEFKARIVDGERAAQLEATG